MSMSDIPEKDMLDMNHKGFQKQFEFALWSVGGSSDYRNDRERPYNGQSHTDHGERGKTLVEGLTMRDVADCFVQGLLAASCNDEIQNKTVETNAEFQGTQYAAKGNWRYQDVYKMSADFDPLAAVQCAMCFVEHMMGIFPSTPTPQEGGNE